MTKEDAKRTLTPRLRFPEFRNDGAWEATPLSDVCDRILDKVGGVRLTPVSITAGRGYVSQAEKFGRDISGAQYKNYIHLRRGDFAYNKGNSNLYPQGCVYRLKEFEEAAASNAFICFKLRDGNAAGFFEGLFEKNTHGRQLVKFLTSGARSDGLLNIKAEEFFSVEFPIPPRPAEQRKVADCLTSLDEVIAAQGRKVEALKAHKKGLMQQLFPREGETLPRLRFPEFRNAPGWRQVAFGDLLQINSGKGFKASEYGDSGLPLLQIENVGYGHVKWGNATVFLPRSYSDKYPELILREGDIVLALNRPITNDELKIAQLCRRDEPSLLYQRVGKVVRTSDLIADEYVLQLCRTSIKAFVLKKSIGSDQPFISLRELYGQQVVIPSPAEQQRISACLSSLDARIAAEAEKLAALKTHKKGLMQQLFPSPEGG